VRAIAADMGAESEARREAQRRRAIGELLFYASKGDVARCKRLVEQFGLDVADRTLFDYDRRTPLHLAAAEGCVGVTEWLLEAGADVNAADRAGSTPLNDALLGDCKVCAQIIAAAGGKVSEAGRLVYFRNSSYADLAAGSGASGASGPGGAGGGGAGGGANILGLANDWEMDRCEVTVQQRLGEGQFGVVSRGEWRGTPVAVKTFKGSDHIAVGEITQELSMLQGLHHPHVIQFIGACTKATPYFIATELALGGSLADVFNMRIQPGVKRCLVIALHAARGMAYLHGRKPHPVIHRDLKPANIMICGHVDETCTRKDLVLRHGVVKVADFGLSRSLQGADEELPGQAPGGPPGQAPAGPVSPSYEMTGETGSYRYMAPEVFKHQRYNHKVDIFAYGVIIFQLFEKRVPFEGLAPEAVARMVSEKNLRPAFVDPRRTRASSMAQTPAAVRQIIQECWHPQPERRPEFFEICRRLEAVIAGMTKHPKKKPEPGDAGPGAGGAAGGTPGGSAASTLASFFGSLVFNKTPSR